MTVNYRNVGLFIAMLGLLVFTGFNESWNSALFILNMGLLSSIMALGVNLQWGYAGLFNVGVMGFVALGGLATVLVSMPPTPAAVSAGGLRVLVGLFIGAMTIIAAVFLYRKMRAGRKRTLAMLALLVGGLIIFRWVFDPAVAAIESVNPASTGYLGGLGLPVVWAWPIGGLFAAAVAWVIGKTALGLRSDYLAIATLGIAEIILAVMKNEDWLSRGVKNVYGIPRPMAREIDLQQTASFVENAQFLGLDPVTASTLFVKLSYTALFGTVLLVLMVLTQLSSNSPWGRMMRAIRDNEDAASAMGKNIKSRHLQIFILGSAICGIAGAMMVTHDGQLLPGTYQPLRFTFLIWVMVIVGGSGNNWGAFLGGMLIFYLWTEVEPFGQWIMEIITSSMAEGSALKQHLLGSVAHMRLLTMGLVLLLVLRFSPRGLIPEK